jgi:PAS domain S-box-containing protein
LLHGAGGPAASLTALGGQLEPLRAGAPVQLGAAGGALRDALGFASGHRVGFAVPLRAQGELVAAFSVLSERPPGAEVIESVLTIADQVALALEGARLSADLHRRQAERRFTALIEQSSDVITIVNDDATITYQTPSAAQVLGLYGDQLVGRKLIDLVHPDDRLRVDAFLADALATPGVSAPVEWRMRCGDGTWRMFENVGNNLRDDPDVAAIVIDSRDVSERKRLEAELEHQAFHDDLTDLANRALFRDRTEHALARAGAVLLENIEQADEAIQAAQRIAAALPRRGRAARLHRGRRADRPDRPDRPLGPEAGLRPKHGVAGSGVATGVDGGQPLTATIRRRESVAGYR